MTRMRYKLHLLTLLTGLLWLTGCETTDPAGSSNPIAVQTQSPTFSGSSPIPSQPGATESAGLAAAAESRQGDFVYRLVSEKTVYVEGEPVKLYGELEYTGSESSVTIYHSASPFYFPMKETTRNYGIAYMMDQPLVPTKLAPGKPLREAYVGSGGYGSQDPKPYIEFMQRIGKLDFPTGTYVVNGFADFYMQPKGGEKTDYKLNATITFQVGDAPIMPND